MSFHSPRSMATAIPVLGTCNACNCASRVAAHWLSPGRYCTSLKLGSCTNKKGSSPSPHLARQSLISAGISFAYSAELPVLLSPWYQSTPFMVYIVSGASMALYKAVGLFCAEKLPPNLPICTGAATSPTLYHQVPLRSMVSFPVVMQYGLSGTKPPFPALLVTRTTSRFFPGFRAPAGSTYLRCGY